MGKGGGRSLKMHVGNVRWRWGQKECDKVSLGPVWSLPRCGHHKVSELLLHGLISARLVALCFFNSLVIFSSSEFGSSGLLYSSSSSLSELSFIFSVSESCFFLAEAISAACLFRHLVLLFWNQTCWEERKKRCARMLNRSTTSNKHPRY